LSPEIEKSVCKIDLSPLNWIEDLETRRGVRKITQQVAGIKFKTYGLPITVSSKEDIRDILVSLGWNLQLELSLEEIENIKTSAAAAVNTELLKIIDVCLVPHANGRRHFICIRIRKPRIQADCTNTPIQLIKHQSSIGKRKRSEITIPKPTSCKDKQEESSSSSKKHQEPATKKTRTSV